jgi:hypothetical protein
MVDGVYGVWCMVYGAWWMVDGVWCMVDGGWCMLSTVMHLDAEPFLVRLLLIDCSIPGCRTLPGTTAPSQGNHPLAFYSVMRHARAGIGRRSWAVKGCTKGG